MFHSEPTLKPWPSKKVVHLLFCVILRICRIVGPSLAASLKPLAHRRNVASLNLFKCCILNCIIYHFNKEISNDYGSRSMGFF